MNICEHCIKWVTADNKTGFCLVEDLFTQTDKATCSDYVAGVPVSEEEWELGEILEDD